MYERCFEKCDGKYNQKTEAQPAAAKVEGGGRGGGGKPKKRGKPRIRPIEFKQSTFTGKPEKVVNRNILKAVWPSLKKTGSVLGGLFGIGRAGNPIEHAI